MTTAKSQITIKRSSEYMNAVRDYQVLVDGKKVGWIGDGETKTYDVPEGHHKLDFKIDWASSPTVSFVLAEGETKTFAVSGFKNGKWLIWTGVFLLVMGPILAGVFHSDYYHFLATPIVLILLHYLTFRRKRYLHVEPATEGQIPG